MRAIAFRWRCNEQHERSHSSQPNKHEHRQKQSRIRTQYSQHSAPRSLHSSVMRRHIYADLPWQALCARVCRQRTQSYWTARTSCAASGFVDTAANLERAESSELDALRGRFVAGRVVGLISVEAEAAGWVKTVKAVLVWRMSETETTVREQELRRGELSVNGRWRERARSDPRLSIQPHLLFALTPVALDLVSTAVPSLPLPTGWTLLIRF